jgi:hypothetical protein
MSKPPTAAERRHHDRIREMPCLGCGAYPVSVHHITSTGYARITKDHRLVAPLCPECHQNGPDAIHQISHRAWCGLHGIDLYDWAVHEWHVSSICPEPLSIPANDVSLPYSGDAA